MKLTLYQVDSFADSVFSGNPAAVCPLDDAWPDDALMQNIAAENNLSETAFYINQNGNFHLRWFTPAAEVDLCGHATLATAFVQFMHEGYTGDMIEYSSRSGLLSVRNDGDLLTMNFPMDDIHKAALTDDLQAGFSLPPVEVYRGKTDYLFIYAREEDILSIELNFEKISRIDARGVIVSAPGKESDFVSRFFAPRYGINEDPVTGSAHTTLTRYWSEALTKNELTAIQLSKRKGSLKCTRIGDRVEISGRARLYMRGEIYV